jgi:hypothetical protein
MAVTDDPGIATSAITATAHLTLLAEHLRELGLLSRVHVASRPLPELVVVNPDASALTEIIYALPEKGTWWFLWSWNERIAPVAETDAVAARIHHVLTPMGRDR